MNLRAKKRRGKFPRLFIFLFKLPADPSSLLLLFIDHSLFVRFADAVQIRPVRVPVRLPDKMERHAPADDANAEEYLLHLEALSDAVNHAGDSGLRPYPAPQLLQLLGRAATIPAPFFPEGSRSSLD